MLVAHKRVHSLSELILFLESLEMLDMMYSIEKTMGDKNGEVVFHWDITYEMGERFPISDSVINEEFDT